MAKPSKENFYKRLNSLAGTNKSSSVNENTEFGTLIDYQKSDQGISYGIIKENHKYFIKKSNNRNKDLDSSDFVYIGGLENKYMYEYNSLSEAEKQRNFYIKSLNEAFSLNPVKNAVNESKQEEKNIENPFDYLKNRISEGKKGNKKKFETKFKSSLKENVETICEKKGLMPEAANNAVKKALGKLTEEEAVSTEDSEIKDADKVSEKKSKETPQAPINDSNAKKEAEKAMGKDSVPKKENDKKSIAVNQTDKPLKEEASPLSTDDSEIISNDSMANKTGEKHEPAQAPVNDTNAKTLADKAVGKSTGDGESMSNQAEESKESNPLDNKEDVGDENNDMVSEGKALSTEDSEQKETDRVANSKKITTKPEAEYNNHNQPEKGHKEEKGEELKSKKEKGAIVAENEAISTKDSHIKTKDSPANKTSDSKKGTGKSVATEDSEENPDDSVANKTKTKLPNPIAEAAEALDSLTEEDLSTSDSETKSSDSLANEKTGNITYDKGKLKKGMLFNMDDIAIAKEVSEDDEVEDELDSAAQALDNMDVEEPESDTEVDVDVNAEPDTGEEEVPDAEMDVTGGEEIPDAEMDVTGGEEIPDAEMDVTGGGEEVPDAEPDTGEDKVKDEEKEREAQSKIGEFGEIVRDLELDDEKIVQLANQAVEPLDTENLSHNDQLKIQAKVTGKGEPPENAEKEIEEPNAEVEEPNAEVDVPDGGEEENQNIQGEGEEEMCAECGTFEDYAKSRGYDNLNECGGMELANLMSGYANAYADGQNDGDFEKVAVYLTPEIETELADYGHDDFLSQAEPFKQQVTDEERLSPGSFDVEVPDMETSDVDVDIEEGSKNTKQSNVLRDVLNDMGYDIENMDDIPEEKLRKAFLMVDKKVQAKNEGRELTEEELNEIGWRDIKNVGAGIANVGQKAGDKLGQKIGQAQQAVGNTIQKGVDKAKQFGTDVKQTYHKGSANKMVQDINQDATKLAQTIAKFNAEAKKAGQQPISPQTIIMKMMGQIKQGGQTDFQHKFEGEEEEPVMEFAPVAQNLGVASAKMSESEKKVRDYIKKRLDEKMGKRKSTINESQKPENLKKLDHMIDEQWKLYQKQVNK